MFGSLASGATLFGKFYADTRKSLSDFWQPLLEQSVMFDLNVIISPKVRLTLSWTALEIT